MPEITRKYVTPGELIVEGNYRALANVVREGERYYASRVGMAEISREGVRVIPLSGPYLPRIDDIVIGKVVDYSAFVWEVDINAPLFGILPAQSVFGRDYEPSRDSLSDRFDIGDMLIAKVIAFDRTRDPLLTVSGPGLGKVPRGEIIRIAPAKVPRLIGKKGSMIKSIESGTRCRMVIGQNGLVVVTGPPDGMVQAAGAIRLVEEEAHSADLMQKVQVLLARQPRGAPA